MPTYAYQVRDPSGKFLSGALAAGSVDEATRALRQDGSTVISVHEQAGGAARALGGTKKVRRDDVIYFASQLAVMVDTGVPLDEALDAIAEGTDHSGVEALVRDLSGKVKAGTEFSAALEDHPKVFSRLFISLMRASEASGTMGAMLQRVSEYLTSERDTRKKIKGALIYPACMLGFCVLVVAGLLIFVLPRFEKIYAGKGAILPAPTRALLALSNGLVNYWPFVLAGLIGAGVGLYFYLRSDGGRLLVDTLRVRVPVLGAMYRKAYLARSLRTMATMVSTGVSMLDGLEITAQVAGNHLYARIWRGLAERVKEGATLSDELLRCDLIPRTVTQMVHAGERTGKLDVVMNRVADYCESDLAVAVKSITSLIEPAMIIVMGLVVGGIAMALLLPIFSISKVVAH